jgi:hypothetical protein
MNRTLHFVKNITFNPSLKRVIADEYKKKYNIHKAKKNSQIIVRKFSTFNHYKSPDPKNPNNLLFMIIAAIGCSFVSTFNNKKK